ncbi:hypothetical protein DFH09DRAFT_1069182 [Mycena vulgaris]|nr:hypothetical protein DFH09DRAFT_1069182 [Mycena vulgaris]
MPTISVINDSDAFQTTTSLEKTGQGQCYRIFSFKKAHLRSAARIVRFTPTRPRDVPIDYWYIPVPCHIIFKSYIFLQRARNCKSESPEVALARRIDVQLLKLRAGMPSQPILSSMLVGAWAESMLLEESSLAGGLISTEVVGSLTFLTSLDESPRITAEVEPNGLGLLSLPSDSQLTSGEAETPGSRSKRPAHTNPGVVPEYGTECETQVGSVIPGVGVVPECEAECDTDDMSLPASTATLAGGVIMGILVTLILRRRAVREELQLMDEIEDEMVLYGSHVCEDIRLPCLESLVLVQMEPDPGSEPESLYLNAFVVPSLRNLHVPEIFLGSDPTASLASLISRSECKLQEVRITGERSVAQWVYRVALPSVPNYYFNRAWAAWSREEPDNDESGAGSSSEVE